MKGLTAIVTGGGSGVGLATAKLLHKAGVNVVIAGRDGSKLNAAVAEIGDSDGRVKAVRADISSEGHANKLVGETVKAFGGLDILVNSAGVFRMGSILDAFEEDYDYVVNVNLKGTWLMNKYGARAMRERGGAIVNVSSLLGKRAAYGFPSSAYSASKGGVLSLTVALAVELAPYKIRVNAVVPALVRTPMLNTVGDAAEVEKLIEQSKKFHPLGRIGEPEDVARAIMFLANPENDWISGTELHVDGGRGAL
jgi:NAD(P)-dependent dehydrogenase (short-subunit alcohol dehydrogenase family)